MIRKDGTIGLRWPHVDISTITIVKKRCHDNDSHSDLDTKFYFNQHFSLNSQYHIDRLESNAYNLLKPCGGYKTRNSIDQRPGPGLVLTLLLPVGRNPSLLFLYRLTVHSDSYMNLAIRDKMV
jgi:hypothetical protein